MQACFERRQMLPSYNAVFKASTASVPPNIPSVSIAARNNGRSACDPCAQQITEKRRGTLFPSS
jgi:hypothetical protein